jgi:hypothetical protein
MFVADEQQVGMRGVQILHNLFEFGMHGVLPEDSTAEKRVMAVGDDAGARVLAEILLQPRLFGRACGATAEARRSLSSAR